MADDKILQILLVCLFCVIVNKLLSIQADKAKAKGSETGEAYASWINRHVWRHSGINDFSIGFFGSLVLFLFISKYLDNLASQGVAFIISAFLAVLFKRKYIFIGSISILTALFVFCIITKLF